MTEEFSYSINTDIKYNPLELIDIGEMHKSCRERWFNQSLCQVNDCVVRLGIIQGEFHWHKHDDEDEFFYVIDGQLFIDLEERTVELSQNQGFAVSRGTKHRTRAPTRTAVMVISLDTVVPTGD